MNKKFIFINFIIILIIVCTLKMKVQPTIAKGSEYFVAKDGVDKNSGTIDKPFKSIQKSLSKMQAGDVLFIRAGEYKEKITFPVSGLEKYPITLKNYEKEKVIIYGDINEGQGLIDIIDKSYINIEGLELCNRSKGEIPTGIMVSGTGNGIGIRNNKIYNIKSNKNAHGIAIYGDNGKKPIKDLKISNNEVYDCKLGQSESVVVNGNVQNFEIAGNIIHDNDNIGIDCIGFEKTASANDQARYGIIKDNYIYNISSKDNPTYNDICADGIYIDGGRDIIIEKNKIENCDIGIEIASEKYNKITKDIVARNNIILNNQLYGFSIGGAGKSNGYADMSTFINNTLVNNEVGINIAKTKKNFIKNNIIYGKILLEGKYGKNVLSYNLWFSKSGNPLQLSMFAKPNFIDLDNCNFNLNSDSPAINAGDSNDLEKSGQIDFTGNMRVIDEKIDIGAIEYNAAINDHQENNLKKPISPEKKKAAYEKKEKGLWYKIVEFLSHIVDF